MEVVQSFQIDHTKLEPGIYVSRKDYNLVTFDIRMTAPNREPVVMVSAMHTLEHLLATWFRNRKKVKQDVIYVGPMGCMTGMYIIMLDNGYTPETMRDLMIEALEWILEQDSVPATTPETCGDCRNHNLPAAKYYAQQYAERLRNNFHSQYCYL